MNTTPAKIINNFSVTTKQIEDFQIPAQGDTVRVIEAINGEIVTNSLTASVKKENGLAVSDIESDILKLTVVNRYNDVKPSVAFIKNFNLQEGAIASCVGHDSHNIIAVGVDDESICRAVNLLIDHKGGIAAVSKTVTHVLSLPIAGIMSDQDGLHVGKAYASIDLFTKEVLGTTLNAPFMTLSFMALLVIPELKLSDKGLFDGKDFRFTSLFC